MKSTAKTIVILAAIALLSASPAKAEIFSTLNAYVAAQSGPSIDMWYAEGNTLTYGQSGWPQDRINVLGRVINHGTETLWFRLNPTGDPNNLADKWIQVRFRDQYSASYIDKRLQEYNDFNIELFDSQYPNYTEIGINTIDRLKINQRILKPGANTLQLAFGPPVGQNGEMWGTKDFTIQYAPIPAGGPTSVSQRAIWWDRVRPAPISSVARVIDGNWELTTEGLKVNADNIGFDRLVGVGDVNWKHYDVLVSFTPHLDDTPKSGGIGVIANFTGHMPDGSYYDPMTDWKAIGAYSYYSFSRCGGGVVLRLSDEPTPWCLAKKVSVNEKVWLRLKVEAGASVNDTRYSTKLWLDTQPEPEQWDNSVPLNDTNDARLFGSVLLVAHDSAVTFHSLSIVPLGETHPSEPPPNPTATATTKVTVISTPTTPVVPGVTPQPTSRPNANYTPRVFAPLLWK